MSNKEQRLHAAHKPARAWARHGLSKIKALARADELQQDHRGFTELAPDPRRQMSWDNFFARFDTKPRHHHEGLDGHSRPLSPFA